MKQYGAIPYLHEDGVLKLVLVTSAGGAWIFPKGRYEEKLGKRGTARLEALEEAGVEGEPHKPAYKTVVGVKNGDRVKLKLYPMRVERVLEKWDEDFRRKRKTATIEEAKALISSRELLECLERFERDFAN